MNWLWNAHKLTLKVDNGTPRVQCPKFEGGFHPARYCRDCEYGYDAGPYVVEENGAEFNGHQLEATYKFVPRAGRADYVACTHDC